MKRAIALVLLAGLLVTCSEAHAAKVQVTWTNPSMNTDGSVLTNLASVTVVWGACVGGSTMGTIQASAKVLTTVDGAQLSTFAFPVGLNPVCLAAYASNSLGENSALSNVVVWTPPATLGAPNSIAGVVRLTFKKAKS